MITEDVSSQPGAELATTAPRSSIPDERRHLTVLFCDLQGSTELSTRLDPEDLLDVIREYQQACEAVIRRFDGTIAQYLGDGLLVYFGYPHAHEDDARRAARSGLGIIEAVQRLNPKLEREKGVRLAVRIGIHSGLVVAADLGSGEAREQLAVGETPNVAAHLQHEAQADTILVSAATERLIRGFFACRKLRSASLKGLGQMLMYEVLHESTARTRLDVIAPSGWTPLVGRDADVRRLLACWEKAKIGDGQVLLLAGEPGIGKSRLARLLTDHAAEDQSVWLTPLQCSPYFQDTALHPVVDLLERVVLQFSARDGPKQRLEKLEGWLVQYGFSLPEAVPLFASLLQLPVGDRYPPPPLSPERQKQQTLDMLVEAVLSTARKQPVLFLIEDLHWADPSTLELLDRLVEQIAGTRILALFTYRPDFEPPWEERSTVQTLTVGRLPPEASAQVIAHIAEGHPLPAEVRDLIIARTDGVPLFLEELTRTVLESEELASVAVPASLHDSLMARLDRLGRVKAVAQLSATVGREFPYELLEAVSEDDPEELREDLAQLVDAELLTATGVSTYSFRHTLIQEAAYESLLRRTRQRYHGRIAEVLAERFPVLAESQPELIARHLTEAGRGGEAIPHWTRAGERAMQRSANLEAIAHLSKALELVNASPKSPEQAEQEFALQVLVAVPLTLTRGWAAPEVGAAYQRAQELRDELTDEALGQSPHLFPALVGLFTYYLVSGQFRRAYDMAERNAEVAERSNNVELLLEAEHDRGTSAFYLGRMTEALPHLQRVTELYEPARHHHHVFLYGKDPAATSLEHQAIATWYLGYPDRALDLMDQAVALTEKWPHPFSHAWALIGRALVHQLRGEPAAVKESAQRVIALAEEQVFPNWLAQGMVYLGWAMTYEGQIEEGPQTVRDGVELWRQTGARLALPYFLAIQADALRRAREVEPALSVVDEALREIEQTHERWWEPDLHRLRGELMLDLTAPDYESAVRCIEHALDLAAERGARSLELRAVFGLARARCMQGLADEARQVLEPSYRWFEEGLETRDLVEARTLLASLATAKEGRT